MTNLLPRFEAHARAMAGSDKTDIQVAHKLAQRWVDRLTAAEFGEGKPISINAARFDLKWLDDFCARRARRMAA